MSLSLRPVRPLIEYPDSDGQPMAENTLQFEWIVTIKGNLDALFVSNEDVFVAGDLLWYPVEGQPKIRLAPDALVVFGRPKGYRGSYRQWEEAGIAPQVVFEILSPDNRIPEMTRKFKFYEQYGVEEYYVYDPEQIELTGWLREGNELKEIPNMHGWISPRLKIRFEMSKETMTIFGPDGQRFATFVESVEQRKHAEQESAQAEQQRAQAEQEKDEALRLVQQLRERLKALGDQTDV